MSLQTPKLLQILANPAVISDSELDDLKQLVQQYPYFQLGHTLIAKATHDRQSADAYDRLHQAAIYAPSRKMLKQLLYEENSSTADHLQTEALPQQDDAPADTSETTQTSSSEQEEAEDQSIYQELQENLYNLQQMRKNSSEELEEENNAEQQLSAEDQEDTSEASTPESSEEEEPSSDRHSAYQPDYLQGLSPLQGAAEGKPQEKQNELIDKFINSESNVRIRWRYQENDPEDLSEKNMAASQHVATENMAGLYVRQGRKDKAIEIYEQLILKYPDKKTYFAEKIESLKEK